MPDISDAELAEYKAAKESKDKLEIKNKELIEEKKKEKELREAAEKLAKESETKALKEAGDYKTLSEKYEADRVQNEKEKKESSERLEKGAKLSKIQEELSKAGIDANAVSHALRLVDLNEVKYDVATGIVLGADVAASKLKIALPGLFVKTDPGNNSHQQNGGGAPAEMTPEWFFGLPVVEQDKHRTKFLAAQGVTVTN